MPALSPNQSSSNLVRFACPGCGKSLKAGIELAGKRTKCRKCGTHITVPTAGTSPDNGNPVAENEPDPYDAWAHMATDPDKGVAASWDKSAQELHEQILERIADETASRLRNARDPGYIVRNIWIVALVFGLMAWIGIFFGYYVGMVDRPPRIGAFIASTVFSFPWACGVSIATGIIAYLFCYESYRRMKSDFAERQSAEKEHRSKLLRDEGPASDCPQCGTERSGILVSRERTLTGEIGYTTVHEPVPTTDSLGKVTGYIQVPVKQAYKIAVLRRSYTCSQCNHRWHHDEQLLPGL